MTPFGRIVLPVPAAIGVALSLVAVPQTRLDAQVVDQGTLVVRTADAIIAREQFVLAASADGFVLTATSLYPPRRTRVTLESRVEVGADSLPDLATVTTSNGADGRVAAQFGSRRITVRVASSRGESVREHPAPERYLVVDDSIFALYALPPGMSSGPVRLFALRGGTRSDVTLTNRGLQPTTLNGTQRNLVELALESADGERLIWFDRAGRLMKVEDRIAGITAERTPQTATETARGTS
jgi:hypothetical protein